MHASPTRCPPPGRGRPQLIGEIRVTVIAHPRHLPRMIRDPGRLRRWGRSLDQLPTASQGTARTAGERPAKPRFGLGEPPEAVPALTAILDPAATRTQRPWACSGKPSTPGEQDQDLGAHTHNGPRVKRAVRAVSHSRGGRCPSRHQSRAARRKWTTTNSSAASSPIRPALPGRHFVPGPLTRVRQGRGPSAGGALLPSVDLAGVGGPNAVAARPRKHADSRGPARRGPLGVQVTGTEGPQKRTLRHRAPH